MTMMQTDAGRGLVAVVTGATGAIGKQLVGELLSSPRWRRVVVVGRSRVTVPPTFGIDTAAEEASGMMMKERGMCCGRDGGRGGGGLGVGIVSLFAHSVSLH